jgi:hypothetical protein
MRAARMSLRYSQRKIYLSYNAEADYFRMLTLLQSGMSRYLRNATLHPTDWVHLQKRGEDAVHRWVNEQLQGSTVTVVLIGRDTVSCPYVLHEIRQSWLRGNALLGIHIHDLGDQHNRSHPLPGDNPFDLFTVDINHGDIQLASDFGLERRRLSDLVAIHHWSRDQGKIHVPAWIEEAAHEAEAFGFEQRRLQGA